MTEKIWNIENDHIVWNVEDGQCHFDDIEMSGLYSDFIVKYGAGEDGELFLTRHCFFPTLRTIPNNTHATYEVFFEKSAIPCLLKDGKEAKERPRKFTFDGILSVESDTDLGFTTKRRLFP